MQAALSKFLWMILSSSKNGENSLLKKLLIGIGCIICAFFLLVGSLLAAISSPFESLNTTLQEFTQKYGEAFLPYIPTERDFIGNYPLPCSTSHITSDYGSRIHPITGNHSRHTGIDFGTEHHEEITSIADGVVEAVGIKDTSWGRFILIRHEDDEELGTFYSFYAHLSVVGVVKNQKVKQNQIIGKEGGQPDTDDEPVGVSTGHHLHFEIRTNPFYGSDVDPKKFLSGDDEDDEDEDDE